MNLKLIVFYLMFILFLISKNMSSQNLLNYQCEGGSEFVLKHRPDISDSTYQIYFRRSGISYKTITGPNYYAGTVNSISLMDTCNYFFTSVNIPMFNIQSNPPLTKNPFTGDSTGKRIFKVCGNGFPDSTIINDTWVTPQFRDTFELMKDFWYDTIVTLPEKCGKWQIRNSIGPTNNYSCSLMGTSFGLNTNLDTVLDNFPDPDFNDINALLQFNSYYPNHSPLFLSHPTAIAIKGHPYTFSMNAVDPEQDSLVFSSFTAIGVYDTSIVIPKSAQFIPACRSIDFSVIPFDTSYNGYFPAKYACIPNTNCVQFDPQVNPFDTDSTFAIDPKTGDIHFTAQSAFQSAMVYVKYDEYRNGVWLGTGYREIKFLIFDNPYYQTPAVKIDSIGLVNCSLNDSLSVTTCGGPISIPFFCNAAAPAILSVTDNHNVSLPGATISYSGSQTNYVSGTINWTPPASANGAYNLLITVFDSVCSLTPYIYSHSYVLKIYVSPGIDAGKDTVICEGNSLQLAASSTSMQNIQWNILYGTPNSLSCLNCSNPIAAPTNTSAYEAVYTGTPLSNCKLRDTIVVNVQKNFNINNIDTTICGTQNLIAIKAKSTIDTNAISFTWMPSTNIVGSSNQAHINAIPSNITYTIVAKDTNNCFTKNATVKLLYDSLFAPSLNISPSNGICTGDTLQLEIVGNYNISWSPSYNINQTTGNMVYVWPDTSVQYSASVSSTISICTNTLSELIQVTALRADAGPDYEIFDGEAVILGGPDMLCGPGCQLQWYPNQYLFFNHLMNPKAVPHETITYWVMLSNSSGTCQDQDSVTIRVKCTDIYMPNAFNPQSAQSEYTRHFGPRNVSIDLNYFRIFNRWGDMVFSTNDVSYRWDGTFQGKPQPAGTYVWVLEGKCPNGEWIRKSGNVMLVR